MIRLAALWAPLLGAAFGTCGCRDSLPSSPGPPERLARTSCETLLPSAAARAVLTHPVSYRETRQRGGPYESISCENRSLRADEVFAFDVGCGVGARERFVSAIRVISRAIRQTEPRVGDEAWASDNVYLSWFAKKNCHLTVLLSWSRPHPERLREIAGLLARSLPP
jgi:hypothetical protein